jgi:A/G-specific adenine glycosylase
MPERPMRVDSPPAITNKILAHYDVYARDLPWRVLPGRGLRSPELPDPYRVWLSEIMLQQTTVAAVKPYFHAFTKRWPGVADLAAAADGDVMAAWAGLGYYARARNLLACARVVVADFGGVFPDTEAALLTLPGVGAYTAAAIASIAFGKRAVVVDGNVERVVARLYAVETLMPAAKPELKRLTDVLTPDLRAGDFAQAMMDLGATLCSPKSPACALCPLNDDCKGKADATRYPVRPVKSAKPNRAGTAWWIERHGHVLLVRRPSKGLLGGMLALPSCGWRGDGPAAPLQASWEVAGQVAHVFTHFSLNLRVLKAKVDVDCATELGAEWWPIDQLDKAGLPSLFVKAALVAREGVNTV